MQQHDIHRKLNKGKQVKQRFFFLPSLVFFLFFVFSPGNVFADLAEHFPVLTGHIVDQTKIISPQKKQELEKLLAEHEALTTNQIVVATLPSLHGYPIERFALELGRHWQLGQAEKNNGVLLLVVPTERSVRIEVGYGLESLLTDAATHAIIQSALIPAFKAGKYEDGITSALQDIIQAVEGAYVLKQQDEDYLTDGEYQGIGIAFTVFLTGIFLGPFLNARNKLAPLGTLLTCLSISCLVGGLLCYPWIRFFLSDTSALAISCFLGIFSFALSSHFLYSKKDSMPYSRRSSGSRSRTTSSKSWSSSSRRGGGYSGGGGSFGGGGSSGRW